MVSLNLGPLVPPEQNIKDIEGDDLVEAIISWFGANFEDPAQNTPYEGAEGGYQYIWGGPYDAREEIEDYFGELPEDILEKVFERIDETMEWAPNDSRIYDEEPPDDPYGQMQKTLDALEEVASQVQPVASGIGGNFPPEDIGVPPYTDEDRHNLIKAIQVLRMPEEELSKQRSEAARAAQVFLGLGNRIGNFVIEQGKKFADAYTPELGKRAAQGTAALITWDLFKDRLASAYDAVIAWLGTLPPFPHLPF